MDLDLRDKAALVAGSSRGIGRAIARAFLREGASVLLTGRDGACLEETRTALAAESSGERVRAVQGDMTTSPAITRALEACVSAYGRLDCAVANVGSGSARTGWELDEEDWLGALRTNLVGSMAFASAAIPHLTSAGGGSLTLISSIAGCEAIRAPIPYSAAKAALQCAMKNLAHLTGAEGVRVNAVAPGNVLFPGGSWERKLAERREFFEEYVRAQVPLQRFGTPEEIADAVVFLASARASFITGACLVVDGGQTRAC